MQAVCPKCSTKGEMSVKILGGTLDIKCPNCGMNFERMLPERSEKVVVEQQIPEAGDKKVAVVQSVNEPAVGQSYIRSGPMTLQELRRMGIPI